MVHESLFFRGGFWGFSSVIAFLGLCHRVEAEQTNVAAILERYLALPSDLEDLVAISRTSLCPSSVRRVILVVSHVQTVSGSQPIRRSSSWALASRSMLRWIFFCQKTRFVCGSLPRLQG